MIIPVIFEDNDIVVIDKPSGVVVHPFDFSQEDTVLDFLHEHVPQTFEIKNEITLQDGRTINLGGLVHKLDRDTSGVLLVAKTESVFKELREQFAHHSVQKTYLALVEGNVKEDVSTIHAPLGRNKKDYKQKVNPENPRGELKEAITDVKVLERKEHMTLVELKPKTGRTHQLRAHMEYMGHPIVGDIAYGSKIKAERIMLHASKLCVKIKEKEAEFKSSTSFS